MHAPPFLRTRARLFAALGLLILFGEALGYAACRLNSWVAFVAAALAIAGIATVVFGRLMDQAEETAQGAFGRALADKVEQQRKLRHDIRGALSPVLLVADRLVNHADPAVKRSGGIMIKTVDRATALLAASGDAEANPPADP